MIAVDIISKIVSKGTGKAPSTVGGESNIDLSDYLLKEIWEKVFEIKTDAAGNEYIFGKLPVVTKYGITMYGEELENVPSIFDGLPIDGQTLVWKDGVLAVNPELSMGGGASSLGELLNVDSSVDSTANADMVLFKAANSATWIYKNVNDIINGGGTSGAKGDVLSGRFGSYSANSTYDFYYTGVQKGDGLPSTSPYGSLLTLPYRKAFGNTIPDFAAQIFIPNGDDSSPYLFFRTSLGASWNEWKSVVSLNSKGIADMPIKVYNDNFIVESRSGNSYISYNGINSSVYFGDIGFHKDSGLASIWTSKTGWRPIIYGADYNGNLVVAGGITMYSDQRKKTILNHVELSLKQIANAPLIEHYYNSDQEKTTHVGSIAQYWAGLNDWFCKLDAEGFYTMEIQNAALASAISIARHLEKYETKTDKTIRKMKQRIQELEDEVERLKQN